MSEQVRSELSTRSPYWIDKHRYYELKHFCLQYPIWKRAYNALDGLSKKPDELIKIQNSGVSDPTAKCAESKLIFAEKIEMVEKTAKDLDLILGKYVLLAVTNGYSYDNLVARYGMPCSKGTYYDLYRRFFYELSKKRN